MADSKSRNVSNLPIRIPDVPDAPVIASATNVGTGRAYNNGAATVTFSSPTGGFPSSYAITTTPSTTTTTVTSSPATITGLTSATAYTASITATNVSATSPAATSSSFTATTVPQAPTIGTFTDGGTGTTGTLSFTAGATGGSTITAYKYSTDGTNYTTASGTTSPLSITGLTPATYTFTLKAANANGDSSASSGVSGTVIQPTAFESIASTTATGGSTITFSSIPSTYQHLHIRLLVKTTTDNADFRMTANGVTSGYASHFLVGASTGVSAAGYSSAANIRLDSGAGLSVNSYQYSAIIIDIHDYASTTRNKTFRMFYGAEYNETGGEVYIGSGLTTSTSAISSLSFDLLGGKVFSNPSFAALYGIKGA